MKKAMDKDNVVNQIDSHDIFPKGEEIDISHFSYLYYRYPERENVKIPQPKTMLVGDDGHKVVDEFGAEHFMPSGKNGFFHVKYKLKGESKERKLLLENE